MSKMLLTKSTTFIIGPVAVALGFIMNAIYLFLNNLFNIQNIGLCIILFTIVIYMLLMPLTIKQQKFSKLSAQMNPELQAIQKKYKGKQDQASMMKMNEETKTVYSKYGVSPMGSCLQLLIQMPILFALYKVIWNIPAYVGGIKDAFMPLVDKLLNNSAAQTFLTDIASKNQINFESAGYKAETIVDTLYKFKPDDWGSLAGKFPEIKELIIGTQDKVDHFNNFLGINIADAPMSMLQTGLKTGAILVIIGAIAIPVLAGLTQWFNTKLMPQPDANGQGGTMASSMKTMNMIMPIMSAVFCLTLPAGMGLYWIAGAVIRSVQQIIVNKHMDSVDVEALISKNLEKQNKKREKMGLPPQKISNQAKLNVKNINEPVSHPSTRAKANVKKEMSEEDIKKSTEYYNQTANAKPGSIASKARMVQQYNEKNKK